MLRDDLGAAVGAARGAVRAGPHPHQDGPLQQVPLPGAATQHTPALYCVSTTNIFLSRCPTASPWVWAGRRPGAAAAAGPRSTTRASCRRWSSPSSSASPSPPGRPGTDRTTHTLLDKIIDLWYGEFEILLLMHRISDVRCMLRMDAHFVFDLRLPSKYHKIMKMNFLYV